jgi:hypothetical protein
MHVVSPATLSAKLKLKVAAETGTPPGLDALKSNSSQRFDAKVDAQFPVVFVRLSPAARKRSELSASPEPAEASLRLHADVERTPGKTRFVVTDIGPPVALPLRLPNASEVAAKAAAAAPASAAHRSARRETSRSGERCDL